MSKMSKTAFNKALGEFAKYVGRPGYQCLHRGFEVVSVGKRLIKAKSGTGAIMDYRVANLRERVDQETFRVLFQVLRVKEVKFF
jgi:hypothetical protein